jgi:cyclopropane fatty-acyl-phospholipid synthase-like methyltransferase
MASEFLISWGHIMQALALPPDSSASILEYGSGSGQLLLFLARMGIDVYAVDIDQPSLDLVSAQARAMGLDVKCECALFGEGFSDQKFDRIIFFEAFHHAWDYDNLLDRLARAFEARRPIDLVRRTRRSGLDTRRSISLGTASGWSIRILHASFWMDGAWVFQRLSVPSIPPTRLES